MTDDVNKRMNFFDRQFLGESDFKVEQSYHRDRRRRHNLLMHTPGVAEGLVVDGAPLVAVLQGPGTLIEAQEAERRVQSSRTITAGPGTAIDALGREIVLLTPLTETLPIGPTEAKVYIAYNETFTDPSPYPGISGNTRVTESPRIIIRQLAPQLDPPPPDGVLLAAIKLSNGNLTAAPNNNVRLRAGAISSLLSPDQGGSLELGDRFNELTPYIDFHHGGGANEDFDMRIINTAKGKLAILGGSLGIGMGNPIFPLSVRGVGQAEDLVCFEATNGVIKWHINQNLGGNNPGLNFAETGVHEGRLFLQAGGKVGVGTPHPQASLDIAAGPIHIGGGGTISNIQGAHISWNLLTGGTGETDFINHQGLGSGGFAFMNTADGANRSTLMFMSGSGNVGIGTNAPAAKLDVKGAIRAGNSDIYFTETNHIHTGIGNAVGLAAIENAADHNALMILGRSININALPTERNINPVLHRRVELWDFLQVNGDLVVTGNVTGAGFKSGYVVDRFVNRLNETVEQGDVVVISENLSSLYYGLNNNIPVPEIDLAQAAYNTRVCGIVCAVQGTLVQERQEETSDATKKTTAQTKATKKGTKAEKLQQREFTFDEMSALDINKVESGQIGLMVTLGAFAHCKVDADIAPILVGDLLTTSPTKGHAQKVLDPSKAIGAIIGKALGSLKKGKGKIPVMVVLQ